MTSEGLGEMFEDDSADMCARKLPLVLIGGRVECLECADPEARTPIGASGNYLVMEQLYTHPVIPVCVMPDPRFVCPSKCSYFCNSSSI
jgi:hypothetical protein